MQGEQEEQSTQIQFFFENLFPILQENAQSWNWPADLKQEEFQPTYMDALSNMTYRVNITRKQENGEEYAPILAKKFGEGLLKRLLDRKIDNQLSTLMGEELIGPKVLWFSDEVRVEEFVISQTFSVEDMGDRNQRRKLMYYVQKIHRLKPDFVKPEPLFERYLDESFQLITLFKESVEKKKDLFSEEEMEKVKEIQQLISQEEIDWIKDHHPKADNVLSHNDFLNGNILKTGPGGKSFVLIDYEYSTYNPKAFDIANFITESLFDYDYPEFPFFKYYPEKRDGDEAMRDIVKYYVLFSNQAEDMEASAAFELIEDEAKADAALLELFGDQEKVDAEIEELMGQINICVLLSHYLWILWGIMVCKNPNVNFGYIEFAYQRFLDYKAIKESKF